MVIKPKEIQMNTTTNHVYRNNTEELWIQTGACEEGGAHAQVLLDEYYYDWEESFVERLISVCAPVVVSTTTGKTGYIYRGRVIPHHIFGGRTPDRFLLTDFDRVTKVI